MKAENIRIHYYPTFCGNPQVLVNFRHWDKIVASAFLEDWSELTRYLCCFPGVVDVKEFYHKKAYEGRKNND